ncbi:hypothetical protein PROFUN_06120 [Planoprotostelium fungivorum]|uniref:Uncharacterized protein n=1 Tax=Planoprotostelium fungivorum TaxID=1890364 RepID=A0A2P6NPG8_9EUKA|nr:hypothetical protein PROFUN_06120 [Planoprotostelium fungivorum]
MITNERLQRVRTLKIPKLPEPYLPPLSDPGLTMNAFEILLYKSIDEEPNKPTSLGRSGDYTYYTSSAHNTLRKSRASLTTITESVEDVSIGDSEQEKRLGEENADRMRRAWLRLGTRANTEKAARRLGMSDAEKSSIWKQHDKRYEEECGMLRRTERVLNKKESTKALRILGFNPSSDKLRRSLGEDAMKIS